MIDMHSEQDEDWDEEDLPSWPFVELLDSLNHNAFTISMRQEYQQELYRRISDYNLSELVPLLTQSGHNIKEVVIQKIAEIGDEQAINILFMLLNDKDDWMVRVVVDYLYPLLDESWVAKLQQSLKTASAWNKLALAYMLIRMGDTTKITVIYEAIKSSRVVVRKLASSFVDDLVTGPNPEPLELPLSYAKELLSNRISDIRTRGVILIAKLKCEMKFELLSQALDDPGLKVRRVAIFNLAKSQQERAVPVLIEMFNSQKVDDSTKEDIIWAFRYFDDQAQALVPEDFLINIVRNDQNLRIRQTCIERLRDYDTLAITNLLVSLLSDRKESKKIRLEAINSLRYHDTLSVTSFLLGLFNDQQEAEEIRVEAIDILARHRNVPVFEILMKALSDKSYRVRRHAMKGLGRLKDRQALPALEEAKKDTNSIERIAVVAQEAIDNILRG